ncbi:MAG: divergent polysaccharide deacetylase family protein, partial [Desulfamplus sp.]|nr:divergent polysaccharide deacetylase family protein [Desulfamplus sp.]
KNLDAIPHVKGVNNHMGSAITALSPQMHQIFTILKIRELFFIDSMTSKHSLGRQSAHLFQLPFAERDIFLDNVQEISYIKGQIKKLIFIALKNGYAIGIGHPYHATYLALKNEIPELKKQVRIVPASTLVAVPLEPLP